jgi:hypothetical protein
MPRPDKPVARLGWVLDGEIRFDPHSGPSRLAAEALAGSMRELARLEDIDEATVWVAVLLGEAVDADPTNAALWGQFRAAIADLRGVGAGGDDDALAQLLAGLGAPDVRDTEEPEPGDARGSDRKGRKGAGAAVDAAPGADRRRRRGTTP